MARMSEPPSLPPPPFWRTRYYERQVIHKADRSWIISDDVVQALAHSIRTQVQSDGRIPHWAYIPRLKAYIWIVILADGHTVQNVFKDRDFVE